MVSKRSEIMDGRRSSDLSYGLIYTEVLGWIDLGHAQGTDIKTLLRSIDSGESSRKDYYDITYSQSMIDPTRTMKMGKFITWRIKRGRSYFERKSIALAMMCRWPVDSKDCRHHSLLIVSQTAVLAAKIWCQICWVFIVLSQRLSPLNCYVRSAKTRRLEDGITTEKLETGRTIHFCHLSFPTHSYSPTPVRDLAICQNS